MNIIGREPEIRCLDQAMASNKAELIAVYGRRRVGKTYLIREYFSQQDCYFFRVTGIRGGAESLTKQLSEFGKSIQEVFYRELTATQLNTPNNWHKAFEMLHDAINLQQKLDPNGKKIVLFFDELPWMATPKSGVLEAIDYFWNHYLSQNKRIIFVICGSASSWIIDNIINNKGGLHNRVTLSLPLNVFNLHEANAFLKSKNVSLNREQLTQLYMAVGGVPYYLDRINPGQSAAQAIDSLCFIEGAALENEFDNLYHALFNKAEAYIELVRIIASKRYGMYRSDIESQARLSTKGGTLSKRLQELEQSGFIKQVHVNGKKRTKMYQCVDEFTLFYLRWVEPIKHKHVGANHWQHIINTPEYYAWAGLAFEILCLKHMEQVKQALNIPAGAIAYPWRSNHRKPGAQIDIVFERLDGVITLCEIKYTKAAFAIDKKYFESIQNKIDCFKEETKTDKQVFIAMVSAHGLQQNSYSGIVTAVATLENIVRD